jgi:hypothetical protein
MSLGIFSFDLAALIDSLSCYIDFTEPEVFPAENEISLENAEEILQNTTAGDPKIDEFLMETALSSTVTSVISTQTVKKENPAPLSSTTKPLAPVTSPTLDDKKRKQLEELIKSLQTSIVHNYRSSDIIDETVSLNNVTNFPKREIPKDTENKPEKLREERKREDRKLENLRDELKRAMFRNNIDV